MAGTNPIPVRSQGRDEQALRRQSRTYGATEADPARPLEGHIWIRKDLSPPELRVRIGGDTFSTTLTPV